jgi:putative ABC transport system ATP-binding protein
MAQPIISARDLTKVYPGADTPALNGIDIDIASGQSIAIMGASGSGKTTLLHILAGITAPSAGTVTFSGAHHTYQLEKLTDQQRAKLRREQFGFVFQQRLLLDELTALENVAVAKMLLGSPRREAEAEARLWLDKMGLSGMEGRRLDQMSGGQVQRVAIARAQITGASVLFADEPTGALDSRTGAGVMAALLDVVEDGRTLVMVTHDRDLAARCDRVITIHDGQIESDLESLFDGLSAANFAPLYPLAEGQNNWGVAR